MAKTIFQSKATPKDPEEELLRQIRERVNEAAQHVAKEHFQTDTAEPDLAARTFQAIETWLHAHPIDVPGKSVEIRSQVFPVAGKIKERHSGADAYVSVVRNDDGRRESKGLLVQAKREKYLDDRKERQRLGKQCRNMRRRTDDGYVWVFNQDGVRSAVAPPFATAPQPNGSLRRNAISPGELLSDTVACTKGDRRIGRDLQKSLADGINQRIEQLGAKTWVSLKVSDRD